MKAPKEIAIENTSKESKVQLFDLFNMAPKDSIIYKYADYSQEYFDLPLFPSHSLYTLGAYLDVFGGFSKFSQGCRVISVDGIGLTPYGYYPCTVAGGIDRIFGFDIGRKKLPSYDDSMTDQLQVFCKLCGHFQAAKRTNKEVMSPTWKIGI